MLRLRGIWWRVLAHATIENHLNFHTTILRATCCSSVVRYKFRLAVTHWRDETPQGNFMIHGKVLQGENGCDRARYETGGQDGHGDHGVDDRSDIQRALRADVGNEQPTCDERACDAAGGVDAIEETDAAAGTVAVAAICCRLAPGITTSLINKAYESRKVPVKRSCAAVSFASTSSGP